jgi:hypothetical protein
VKKLVLPKRPLKLATHTLRDLRCEDLRPVIGGAATSDHCTIPTWTCNHNVKRLVVTP